MLEHLISCTVHTAHRLLQPWMISPRAYGVRSERLLKHVCIQTGYSWVSLRRHMHMCQLQVKLNNGQMFVKTPTSFIWVKRGRWKRQEEEEEGEGRDDFSLPLPLFRAENHRGKRKRAEEKEPRGSAEVERNRSRRWRGCRCGWCEDENWFIAALMRSGMPGDSGCSPSPRCGNIKRNTGPPSVIIAAEISAKARGLCVEIYATLTVGTLPVISNHRV